MSHGSEYRRARFSQSLRIHITGGSLGGDFVLPPGYYILGRLGDKELAKTLSECFFVSRAHCVLAVGEEPMLYDLDSLNGTFLNAKKVKRAPIKAGDCIGLGDERRNCPGAACIDILEILPSAIE